MQLLKLYIKEYGILKDFEIDFENSSPYISVLIGANGSGRYFSRKRFQERLRTMLGRL